MKKKQKRPKGAATPPGLDNNLTSRDIITLRLLFYNLDGKLFAEGSLSFNSIYDFATQRILHRKDIQDFLKSINITAEQLAVSINV